MVGLCWQVVGLYLQSRIAEVVLRDNPNPQSRVAEVELGKEISLLEHVSEISSKATIKDTWFPSQELGFCT